MRLQRMMSLALIACLVSMSGCPAVVPFVIGVWLYHAEGSSSYIGFEFLSNGEMNNFETSPRPIGADLGLAGVLSWEKSGDTVIIT